MFSHDHHAYCRHKPAQEQPLSASSISFPLSSTCLLVRAPPCPPHRRTCSHRARLLPTLTNCFLGRQTNNCTITTRTTVVRPTSPNTIRLAITRTNASMTKAVITNTMVSSAPAVSPHHPLQRHLRHSSSRHRFGRRCLQPAPRPLRRVPQLQRATCWTRDRALRANFRRIRWPSRRSRTLSRLVSGPTNSSLQGGNRGHIPRPHSEVWFSTRLHAEHGTS
jgi:hypothetical protein